MASWVFCNRCFQPPSRTACFSLTSCGHVYCDGCLSRGKKDECLICKVPCRTVLLSKHTDWGIQALFMGIDGLCRKYSKETAQISEFQERHRRRLSAFYREKIARLEESLRKSALRMEQLQSMRSSQHTAFSTTKNPVSTPAAAPSPPLLLPPGSAAAARAEPMEVDLTPAPLRRPELVAGPSRISLISPPQDGRMGSVFCHGSLPLSLTPGHPSLPPALRRGPLSAAPGRLPDVSRGLLSTKDFAPANLLSGVFPESWPPGRRQSGRRGPVRPRQPPGPGPQAAHQHLGAAAETAVRVCRPRGPRTREVTCLPPACRVLPPVRRLAQGRRRVDAAPPPCSRIKRLPGPLGSVPVGA